MSIIVYIINIGRNKDMRRYQLIVLLLLLSLGMITSVSAKNVKIEQIKGDLEAIQLGAFKKRKNIFELKDIFSSYDILVYTKGEISRVFIVNIKKNNVNNLLREIKKLYPSAFKATKKIKKLDAKIAQKKFHSKISVPVIVEPHYPASHEGLNSKTILQTRKKFF